MKLKLGCKVVFAEEPASLWTVRALGERYVVLTRPLVGEPPMVECVSVDSKAKKRSRGTYVEPSINCNRYLREVEKAAEGHIDFADGGLPLNILPPRKICKMITLRITAAEHASLSQQAVDAGLSVNTYLLRQLGITVPDDGTKPRGRKPKTAAEDA